MTNETFESRLGRILREAESDPPIGSWEIIQSKIYTTGGNFSFPYLSSLLVGAVLLGGLAIYDLSKPSVDAAVAEYEPPVQENRVSIEPLEQDKSKQAVYEEVQKKSVAEEINVHAPKQNESESTKEKGTSVLAEEHNDPASESGEKAKASGPRLPISISAPAALSESVEEDKELSEPNASSVTISEAEIAGKVSVSIEGVTTCYIPCQLKLKATGEADEYFWDAGVYGTKRGNRFEMEIDEPSEFTVFLTGRGTNGDEVVQSALVTIKESSDLFVPNSFTPNGDGINDEFIVKGTGIESFSLSIVNSKGTIVFSTTVMDEPWVFEAARHELDNEKYIAVVRAVGEDGKVHSVNQPLTIIP